MARFIVDPVASGKRMKELRLENHLMVKDVARELDLSSGWNVCRWESGRNLPSIDFVYGLMDLYGVKDLNDIFVVQRIETEEKQYV